MNLNCKFSIGCREVHKVYWIFFKDQQLSLSWKQNSWFRQQSSVDCTNEVVIQAIFGLDFVRNYKKGLADHLTPGSLRATMPANSCMNCFIECVKNCIVWKFSLSFTKVWAIFCQNSPKITTSDKAYHRIVSIIAELWVWGYVILHFLNLIDKNILEQWITLIIASLYS